jgi:hypothetical protein
MSGEDAVRLVATLIIILLAGLPALFAGWPGRSPTFFSSLWHGVPGSVVVMSGLMLAFAVLAGICGIIARSAGGADKGAGR